MLKCSTLCCTITMTPVLDLVFVYVFVLPCKARSFLIEETHLGSYTCGTLAQVPALHTAVAGWILSIPHFLTCHLKFLITDLEVAKNTCDCGHREKIEQILQENKQTKKRKSVQERIQASLKCNSAAKETYIQTSKIGQGGTWPLPLYFKKNFIRLQGVCSMAGT